MVGRTLFRPLWSQRMRLTNTFASGHNTRAGVTDCDWRPGNTVHRCALAHVRKLHGFRRRVERKRAELESKGSGSRAWIRYHPEESARVWGRAHEWKE
jgi:hypothetical protein